MDFGTSSDPVVSVALWSGQIALLLAPILLFYAIGLRLSLIVTRRREAKFTSVWRPVLAEAVHEGWDADRTELPELHRRDLYSFLHEWNVLRDSVAGDAIENLNTVAQMVGVDRIARRMFEQGNLRRRLIATGTLGHLGDPEAWDGLRQQLQSDNTLLSLMSARGLVQIDADRALPLIISMITLREDWPAGRVATLLAEAGPESVARPLVGAILAASPEGVAKLLAFVDIIPAPDAAGVIHQLLSEEQDDHVITACLKALNSPTELHHVRAFARHERWHIRMLAAKALGRIGEREDEELIIALLQDQQWWVRYRAAQALASLPWMSFDRLGEIANKQSDRFARDILDQIIAEARFE